MAVPISQNYLSTLLHGNFRSDCYALIKVEGAPNRQAAVRLSYV